MPTGDSRRELVIPIPTDWTDERAFQLGDRLARELPAELFMALALPEEYITVGKYWGNHPYAD
jgi:hypothetical protein